MANLSIWKGNFKEAIDNLLDAIEQGKKTNDSNIVRWDYELTSRYFKRIGSSDSAIYYAEQSRPWATPLFKISFPFILMDLDHSKKGEAKKLFKDALSQFRSRIPSALEPLADGLQNLFDANFSSDTASALTALKEIDDAQGGQPVGQNTWERGTLSVRFRRYQDGIDILKKFVQGKDITTSGYIYLLSQYYLGVAYEGLGNNNEAVKHYTEMLKYWGDADIKTKEIRDAKERLAKLTA